MDVIVVGVDGSAHADIALSWALRQAQLAGAELHIVYAYSRWSAREGTEDADKASAHEVLASIVHRNQELLEAVTWRAHAQSAGRGSPAHVLMDEAEQADLIVVGSRGMGGFGDLILGSTSYRLVGRTRTPVVVARFESAAGAAVDTFPIGVAVGVDGSDSSDRALRWAAREARRRDVALDILHAQPLPAHQIYAMGAVPDLDRERARVVQEGERVIERARSHAGVLLDDLHVRGHAMIGPVADALVSFAGGDHLIVVGTRGHSYVGGLLLGSTAHQVLHHARSPVVVVP